LCIGNQAGRQAGSDTRRDLLSSRRFDKAEGRVLPLSITFEEKARKKGGSVVK